jgi:O-antigen ligase
MKSDLYRQMAVNLDDYQPANRLSSLLLFSTVALAPLPFGSTDASATSVWCVVLGLGLALMRPVGLRPSQIFLLVLAAVVVVAYSVVVLEQEAAEPWFAMPSPPLWQQTAELLKTPLPSIASIARNQPWLSVGPSLSMMLTLVCAFMISLERDRARQLLKVVAWSGGAYAVFGIAAYIVDPTKVLWRDKQAYTTVLTSTFINRNTAAVYFGACGLIWELFILERIERLLAPRKMSASTVLRLLLVVHPGKNAIAVTMFTTCLAAMLLTSSRAGVIGSLVIMIAAPALFFRRRWPRKGTAMMLAAGAAMALLLLETLGSGVSSRFDLDRLADGGRWETYKSTLRIIADHAWVGTGLGTFSFIFPAYRSESVPIVGIWDRAHSTPLELASEVGIPLAVLVIAAWIVALVFLVRGIRTRRRDVILPIAGCLVALLALFHSSIDFSLQIPGFSITVAAVVGGGLAQSFGSIKAQSSQKSAANAGDWGSGSVAGKG